MSDSLNMLDMDCTQEEESHWQSEYMESNECLNEKHSPVHSQDSRQPLKILESYVACEDITQFQNHNLDVQEQNSRAGIVRGKRRSRKEAIPQQKPKSSRRQRKSTSVVDSHVNEVKSAEEVETETPLPQHSVDNSLGETLATSLQLIATNSSSPPHPSYLLQQSYKADSVNYTTDPEDTENISDYNKVSQPSQPSTPVADREPLITLSPNTVKPTTEKKKRGRKPKKKIPPEEELEDKYLSDSEMMQPVLHNDGSVTLFQCEVCHKLFNKRQTLRQHFITHTDRFACQFCDARCKSKGDLRTHIQTHTKEKPYHCDVCNTNYTRESILKKHLKTQIHLKAVYERDELVEMQKLRKKGGTKAIDKFIPSKTKVKLDGFLCEQCSKVLLTKSEYKRHIKSHLMTHVCHICQKGCKTALLLKVHLRSHQNENKLYCKTCNRKFATLQFLKDHLKTHKLMAPTKKPDQSLIKAVITKHNKDIKMMKMSETKENTQPNGKSRKTGSRKATFECNMCHRMFTSEKRLSNHLQTHKGVFPCSVCSKTFLTPSKLSNHMLEHEQLSVKCEICHAPFTSQDQLTRHVESQHCEGSELVCKICYKSFESAAEVHKHMNEHAPTMLFSGDCLDESSIPVIHRGKRLMNSYYKLTDSEESSDDEKKPVTITKIENGHAHHKQNRTTEEKEGHLTTSEFIDIMNTAVEMGDIRVNHNEESDLDDEAFCNILEALDSQVISSGESDADEDTEGEGEHSATRKPILYCHGDIVRKHGDEYEQYCYTNASKGIYQCTLCSLNFDREKYLSNHIKSHVCEYCNKFFTNTVKLTVHKSSHVKRLLNEIENETKKIHQTQHKSQKWMNDSSDSDVEYEARFLNDLEDILDSNSAKFARSENFLKTLSHDEIVKANKQIFEEHSFVDAENNVFACTICKRKYARPTTLTRHFKTHVCQYCNTFFADKTDLLEHKYRHRKRAALMKAEITGEGSKLPPSPVVSKENRALFKRFSYVDTERNINRCTLCSKNFVRRTVLTRHLKTHVCPHCDKFFEDKYDLVKHATFHKVEKQYTDEDGDDEGEDFLEYDEDAKPFPHPSPQEPILREKSLNIPSSYSSTLPPYNSSFHVQPSCNGGNEPIAYIQLPRNGNVGSDSQVFPNQSNGTPFQIIPQPVSVYKENGSDSFLVSSTACQSSSQDKIITITQPQMVQDDVIGRERLFECGECGKRFFKNGHLKSHMAIHTGSKPFVCGVCGKAFSRGTTLRKHEKTHLKRCKICDTTFASKYELDLHLEMHRTYAFYK
ncbi:zinc finger protein Xfin [Elysia marginata]|uniref:Zinc finger protein Xfin n=1 Tax=Elysia marginata TaxID=1093978 RepID=A0AAV4GLC5_9GAST|nr:zinc finger protein Xfin [Elysia marginata]